MSKEFMLLIDGSSLLFTQYFGNLPDEIKFAKTLEEKEANFDKILMTSTGIYTNAVYGFMKVLMKILQEQKPIYLGVAWDISRDNFRKKTYSEYKSNRDETQSPLLEQLKTCQKLLDEIGIKQFFSKEFEADDYCGSIAKKFEKKVPIKVISKDHDYFQIISENTNVWLLCSTRKQWVELHKKYGTDKNLVPDKTFELTPELLYKEYGITPDVVPMLKGLQGDTADNIKGIPGIGEKTAKILANEYKSMDNLYNLLNSLDKNGLETLKTEWKANLKLSRSPIPYLLANSEISPTGDKILKGEEAGRLSEFLATIKKDIELNFDLNYMKFNLDKTTINSALEKLEMKSILMK